MRLLSHAIPVRWFITVVLFFSNSQLGYSVVSPKRTYSETPSNHSPQALPSSSFPSPPHVASQVRFWTKVFYKYGNDAFLIHDTEHPDIILDVVDFNLLSSKTNASKIITRPGRDKIIAQYLKRYELALQRFAREGASAAKFGAMEERVLAVYQRDPAALRQLLSGQAKLRSQSGLKEEFVRAAERAQFYIPEMTKIFQHYNVPTQLTRIAFVESMFNLEARSKVGASGIWQIMPATARMFVHVNSMVDERNAPLKATRVAARILQDNYRTLKSWPLAITAYNHGAAGMRRAERKTGSKDIGKIITSYESPSFGFASKNFYAEFLAAHQTYEKLLSEGRISNQIAKENVQFITLPRRVSIAQLTSMTPLSRDLLRKHNPCILQSAYSSLSGSLLPMNYEVVVPRDIASKVKYSVQNMRSKKLADRRG